MREPAIALAQLRRVALASALATSCACSLLGSDRELDPFRSMEVGYPRRDTKRSVAASLILARFKLGQPYVRHIYRHPDSVVWCLVGDRIVNPKEVAAESAAHRSVGIHGGQWSEQPHRK